MIIFSATIQIEGKGAPSAERVTWDAEVETVQQFADRVRTRVMDMAHAQAAGKLAGTAFAKERAR